MLAKHNIHIIVSYTLQRKISLIQNDEMKVRQNARGDKNRRNKNKEENESLKTGQAHTRKEEKVETSVNCKV